MGGNGASGTSPDTPPKRLGSVHTEIFRSRGEFVLDYEVFSVIADQ
jgi:hypothetical protein